MAHVLGRTKTLNFIVADHDLALKEILIVFTTSTRQLLVAPTKIWDSRGLKCFCNSYSGLCKYGDLSLNATIGCT